MTIPTLPTHTLSKSDFKLARTCATKLYYKEMRYPDSSDSDGYLQMLAKGGYMVEMLAKLEHPDGIALEYGGDQAAAAARTMELLVADSITLFEATLLKDSCLARVDILRKRGNSFALIEVKAKSLDTDDAAKRLQKTGSRFRSLTNRDRVTGIYPLMEKWRPYLEDVAYQVLLLQSLYPLARVTPYLTLVRKDFRAPVDRLPSWFTITEHVGSDGKTRVRGARFTGDSAVLADHPMTVSLDVTEEVNELLPDVHASVARFVDSMKPELRRLPPTLGMMCRDCSFVAPQDAGPSGWHECWGDRAVYPHILELFRGSTLVDSLVSDGYSSLLDIPVDRLGTKSGDLGAVGQRQLIQIEYSRTATEWRDPLLSAALEGAIYPLHFIDFEAAMMTVPYHKGMAPYGRLAFQWSCHTIERPGASPTHREWINTEELWPNAAFASTLRSALGDTGTVYTWSHFEEDVLASISNELEAFGFADPALKAWLDGIVGNDEPSSPQRVVDLHKLCSQYYFHPGMRGRTGIKYVIEALWSTSEPMRARLAELEGHARSTGPSPYASLPPLVINGVSQQVAEGTGAIRAYEAMMYGVERDDEVAKAAWKDLLRQYCRLDTLAMILIYEHWLR